MVSVPCLRPLSHFPQITPSASFRQSFIPANPTVPKTPTLAPDPELQPARSDLPEESKSARVFNVQEVEPRPLGSEAPVHAIPAHRGRGPQLI